MSATDLSANRLREVLHYEADDGVFVWKLSRGRHLEAKRELHVGSTI